MSERFKPGEMVWVKENGIQRSAKIVAAGFNYTFYLVHYGDGTEDGEPFAWQIARQQQSSAPAPKAEGRPASITVDEFVARGDWYKEAIRTHQIDVVDGIDSVVDVTNRTDGMFNIFYWWASDRSNPHYESNYSIVSTGHALSVHYFDTPAQAVPPAESVGDAGFFVMDGIAIPDDQPVQPQDSPEIFDVNLRNGKTCRGLWIQDGIYTRLMVSAGHAGFLDADNKRLEAELAASRTEVERLRMALVTIIGVTEVAHPEIKRTPDIITLAAECFMIQQIACKALASQAAGEGARHNVTITPEAKQRLMDEHGLTEDDFTEDS